MFLLFKSVSLRLQLECFYLTHCWLSIFLCIWFFMLLYMSVCVCLCEGTYVCVYTYVCVCLCGGQRWTLSTSLSHSPSYFLRNDLSLTWSTPIHLGPRDALVSDFLCAGMIGMRHCIHFLNMWDWIQALRLVWNLFWLMELSPRSLCVAFSGCFHLKCQISCASGIYNSQQ